MNSTSSSRLFQLPAHAGIEGAAAIGMPVDECARRLARFAAAKRSLVRIAAGRMTGALEWELKALLGRTLWEDAIALRELELRLRELRSSPAAIAKVLEYQLGDFFTELLHTPDSLALAVGWFDVLLPDFISALRRYLEQTQPLVDQPSVRLLRQLLSEAGEQRNVGDRFVTVLAEGREGERDDWKGHLSSFLAAAGGVWGEPVTIRPSLRPRAPEGEFQISREFKRDGRFHTSLAKEVPAAFAGDDLRIMIWARSQEMTAAEMLASVIYEWDPLPTDAIVDLARHCWDEARHALFGCAALAAEGMHVTDLPSWIGYAHHTLPAPPPKRYAHLAIATEAAAMAYPGGKRGEWEFCRDRAKHPLMTTFQDFDWADEVNHVGFGRKWLIDYHFKGNREEARKVADETMAERRAYYAGLGGPGQPAEAAQPGY